MDDVRVIGGGPTGCLAAMEAAKRNLNVTVFEEHGSIGSRLKCSGIISKKGLDTLGVDYKKSILNEFRGTRIYSPSLNEMNVIAKDIKAFAIDRKEFDTRCADEAENAGARILLKKRAVRSDVTSKLLIGADGALSQVARWFSFPEMNEFAFCYQADFQNAAIEDKSLVSVFLSNKLFPGFFGWAIPLNESEARVGLGVFRDVRNGYTRSVKHYFDLFTKKHPIVSKILKKSKSENRLSAIIPLSTRDKTASGDVLLVGDAAGQVKATTGGGVVFGGNCAKLAGSLAPRIIERKDSSDYERSWKKKFGDDLRLHKKLRGFYNSLTDGQIDSYLSLAKKTGMERFLAKNGDMDSPTAMFNPAVSAAPLHAVMFKAFSAIISKT
ncbi:MAG: NAD(P)/FAD-dependent oxidoreductase [Candidatus Micrarchaeota archaeon]|nr:NAD(P)/FAD-dependent oxidoreductase [Candidatus Micrarchaeota archaeon]